VLLVTVPEAIEHVHIPEIIRCAAQNDHTELHMKHGDILHVDKAINEVEFMLSDYGFFRVHPAHIVNLREVRKTNRARDGLLLKDGSVVPLSSGRKKQYLDAFKKFTV